MSRLQGRVRGLLGGNRALTEALMLDHWLRELTFSGPYDIPIRCTGAEISRDPGPKLYTWTHVPLAEVPLRPLMDFIPELPVVVSDAGKVVDGDRFLVFGWKDRLPAIDVGPDLMRRVLTAFRGGQSVVFMSDPYLGGPLSDVPMRLARRAGVPVIFLWAQMAADNVLECQVRYAPHRMCESDAAIEENLEFLREANRRTLDGLAWRG